MSINYLKTHTMSESIDVHETSYNVTIMKHDFKKTHKLLHTNELSTENR